MFGNLADTAVPELKDRQTGRLAERFVANFAQVTEGAFSPKPGTPTIFQNTSGSEVQWVNGTIEQKLPYDVVLR